LFSCFAKYCLILGVLSISLAYEVTSNEFEMSLEKNILSLSKDIEIKTEGYNFYSENADINLNNKIMEINSDFIIKFNNQSIKGKNLMLDGESSVLTANQTSILLGKYTLSGELIRIKNNEFVMNKVLITTCQGGRPIVYLRSNQVNIYSQYGFLVAFDSFVHVLDVPVMYFPAYFLGDRRYSSFAQNKLVPEIGSNQVEGAYIRENLPYYMDAFNNGTVHLGLIEKFGLKTGFQHNNMNDSGQQKTTLGIYYSSKTWQGNFSYSYKLFTESITQNHFIDYLFQDLANNKPINNLDFSYSLKYQELINNQFVNIWPAIKTNAYLSIDKSNELGMSYEIAQVEENNVTKDQVISYTMDLSSSYKLYALNVTNRLEYRKSNYIGFDLHERLQDNIGVYFWFAGVNWKMEYEHIFSFRGFSPFAYDFYNIDIYDKITVAGKIKLKYFDVEYTVKKRLETDYYYSRRIEISWPYEACIDFRIYWEDVEKTFGVSVQL